MTKLVLDSVNSGYDLSKVNTNFQKIVQELQNKILYRNNPDGEPNTLEQDIDANNKTIYNLPIPDSDFKAANKIYVDTKLSVIDGAVAQAQAAASEANTYANSALAQATASQLSAMHSATSESNANSSALAAANSASQAAIYGSMGLGGAVAFDMGYVTDLIVIFPTDWGTIP
ncbi:MAG TPA: hypothetical protein VFM18_21760 [Methanosarcina sp.]|nr:hypothetical protein [Methanosarcina sp.]